MGDARRMLVAFRAGEAPDPPGVGSDDLEPGADLGLAHDGTGRLPLEVGAEAQAVHTGFQGLAELVHQGREFQGWEGGLHKSTRTRA